VFCVCINQENGTLLISPKARAWFNDRIADGSGHPYSAGLPGRLSLRLEDDAGVAALAAGLTDGRVGVACGDLFLALIYHHMTKFE
jgi:hypothetical protein